MLIVALLWNRRSGKLLGLAGVVMDLLLRNGVLFWWGLLIPAEGSVIAGLLKMMNAVPVVMAPVLFLLIQGCLPILLFLKSGFPRLLESSLKTIRLLRKGLLVRMIQKVYCWLAMTAVIVTALFSLTAKLIEKVNEKRETLMVELDGEVQLVQAEMIQLFHQLQPMFWTMIIGFGVVLGAVICSLVFESRRKIIRDVRNGGGEESTTIFLECLQKDKGLRSIEWMLRRQVFVFAGVYFLIVFSIIYPALLRARELCYAGV